MLQIFVTDLMISIFKHPSCVGRTKKMKKTTRDVDVTKTNMMKFSMIQMSSLLVEDG